MVELLLSQAGLLAEEVAKALPLIFSLVSNVQTTVGGGVDLCIIRDNQSIEPVIHNENVPLDELRAAIFDVVGIKH